jgi:hypothetical protein
MLRLYDVQHDRRTGRFSGPTGRSESLVMLLEKNKNQGT